MADNIKGKPRKTTLAGTEGLPLEDSGNDRHTLISDIYDYVANLFGQWFDFTPQDPIPSYQEGRMFYQDSEKCIAVMNDRENTLRQLGREIGDRALNNTGVTITNGQVVYISGDNGTVRTIGLADASDSDKSLGTIGFATEDILDGEIGEVTFIGKVRDVNTSTYTVGDILYLSPTPGGHQNTIPESPDYVVILGNCGRVGTTDGQIDAKIIPRDNTQGTVNLLNGAILEDHTITVTSNGTTITLSLEKNGGGDISLFLDGLFYTFDCTPAATIELTAGTDAIPVRNWVYIPNDTKVLTVSFTGFPTTVEYTPIADVVCQSAASVQTYGVYKNHKWTDHLSDSIGQGHLSHINYWIRNQSATYQSGIDPSISITINPAAKDDVYFSTTAGMVLQMHPHVFPAKDMATGDGIYIVNRYTLPYSRITNLNAITNTSDGTTLLANNTYYTIFIYGIVSEEESECKYFGNVPSGFYTNETDAINDPNGYTNKTMLSDYKGTAFPIAGVVLRYQTIASGTITLIQLTDLRESESGGGSPTGTVTSTFTDAAFKVVNATDPTKIIQLLASGITTGTTRTFTAPDESGTLAVQKLAASGVTYGQIDDQAQTIYGAKTFEATFTRIKDTTAQAIGTGGAIYLNGKYIDDGTAVDGGWVKLSKVNSTSTNYSFDLLLGSRANGAVIVTQFKIGYDGKLYIITAPATAASTAPLLARNSSTGAIELKSAIFAPETNAATSKTTPVDADELAIVDSAASNVIKKLTWANLKATLKTYFDTLYAPIVNTTSITSSATPSPVGSARENEYYITSLAAGATFAAPSGTPVNGNTLIIRIKDNATAQTLAWNAIYYAFAEALPTTTILSKTMYCLFIYDSAASKWNLMKIINEI